MSPINPLRRFILLPARGLQNHTAPSHNSEVSEFLVRASDSRGRMFNTNSVRRSISATETVRTASMSIRVLDSAHEDGAKLVEMKEDDVSSLRLAQPGLRIVPEVFYELTKMPQKRISTRATMARTRAAVSSQAEFQITNAKGEGIKGVLVVAFTDFQAAVGAEGKTKANGKLSLTLDGKRIERLYLYPDHSYWPYLYKDVRITSKPLAYVLQDATPGYKDALQHFYGKLPSLSNRNIRVGVIDTGVGPHDSISIKGGACLVLGEEESDYADYDGHGTHVAGIIAGKKPMKGVAPGMEIMSYRVFDKAGRQGASNFAILNAIDRAVSDGCHLINMSLGGQYNDDEGVSSAIRDAYSKGVLCFVATGNDDRLPVAYPARHPLVMAVTAFGRKGTFPSFTEPHGSIKAPYGKDKKNFIASFSNIGNEVDLTSTGVGIVSCYPGQRYAVMSGTSMACPAVCGMMARLLSGKTQLMQMPADQTRTDAFVSLLAQYTKRLGFGAKFEGGGMPR